MQKPFSPACENNKRPIQQVLEQYLTEPGVLLEVGSGTGQHSVHMARQLPQIQWQATDINDNLAGIKQWQNESGLPNVLPPLVFDVTGSIETLNTPYSYLFSANTLHIMSWPAVEHFFTLLPQLLKDRALVFLYGPFKYQGQYTSVSNADFDQWLKRNASHQGIRDFEAIAELAQNNHLVLLEDIAMPANNQTLVWQLCL